MHLEVVRSGDTTGTIAVDYWVTYLPADISEPAEGDSSVFAAAIGSVRLQGGQQSAEVDVNILNEAFLDEDAQFYVKLNSTYLVEGGESV